jgi:uncharacterized protein YndB with AHSA1/START domain
MPKNRDFKRLVRARMKKTGESYTAARTQLLRRPARASASRPVSSTPAITPTVVDYAAMAGFSDAAVEKRTGSTWKQWVAALDRAGATGWPHRAIAEHLRETCGVPGWWSQAVTVGYERIKGIRDIGQRLDGKYDASKSRTLAAPPSVVYRAFTDARMRRRWLPGVAIVIRRSTPGRTVRMTWDDGTSVEAYLTPKGETRTVASIQHGKLAGKEDVARRKAYWDDRLKALGALVNGKGR